MRAVDVSAILPDRGGRRQGERLWETRGEIRDEAGELIARAAGTYFPLFAEESEKVLADLTIDGRAATWVDLPAEE